MFFLFGFSGNGIFFCQLLDFLRQDSAGDGDDSVFDRAVDVKIGDLASIDQSDKNLPAIFDAQGVQPDCAMAVEFEDAAHRAVGGVIRIDSRDVVFGNDGNFTNVNHLAGAEKFQFCRKVGAVGFCGLRVKADGNFWLPFCESEKATGEDGEEEQAGGLGKFHT